MPNYIVRVKHGKGITRIKTFASSPEWARHIVKEAERCPDSAILSVEEKIPAANLTDGQKIYLELAEDRRCKNREWFTPVGQGWRICDSLVKKGLLEHNGAERHGGEKYRITDAGRRAAVEQIVKKEVPCERKS